MNNEPLISSPDERWRAELRALLAGANAHMAFEDAVSDFPLLAINQRALNVPYSFWQLLEHLRIAQADILDFITNAGYVAPEWPAGYWPDPEAQATPEAWHESIAAFQRDRAALLEIIADPETDLTAELAHAPGYTIAREILLVADHNAYHLGELGILRQVMSLWD
jgi:hypothetical protein